MSKLPAVTPDKVIRILEKNGFVLDRVKGSQHIYYHRQTRKRAVVPMHKKDLPKGTLIEILKQAGLTKEDFTKLL